MHMQHLLYTRPAICYIFCPDGCLHRPRCPPVNAVTCPLFPLKLYNCEGNADCVTEWDMSGRFLPTAAVVQQGQHDFYSSLYSECSAQCLAVRPELYCYGSLSPLLIASSSTTAGSSFWAVKISLQLVLPLLSTENSRRAQRGRYSCQELVETKTRAKRVNVLQVTNEWVPAAPMWL